MARNKISDGDVSARDRGGNHERARFDLIGDNGIGASVETLDSADPDNIGSGALDVRSHAVKEVRHINDVGLLRAVLENGLALCKNRCEHNIDRRAYRDKIKEDMVPRKLLRLGIYHTEADVHIRSQSPEALRMLLDRPASDIASARKGNLRTSALTQKRTDKII